MSEDRAQPNSEQQQEVPARSPERDDGGAPPSRMSWSAKEEEEEVQATPAAKRKAEELGVDLSRVQGTGSGGRITLKDVREAAQEQ